MPRFSLKRLWASATAIAVGFAGIVWVLRILDLEHGITFGVLAVLLASSVLIGTGAMALFSFNLILWGAFLGLVAIRSTFIALVGVGGWPKCQLCQNCFPTAVAATLRPPQPIHRNDLPGRRAGNDRAGWIGRGSGVKVSR